MDVVIKGKIFVGAENLLLWTLDYDEPQVCPIIKFGLCKKKRTDYDMRVSGSELKW